MNGRSENPTLWVKSSNNTRNKNPGYMVPAINPTIFREYDIRGVAEVDLPSPVVETIPRAYARYVSKQNGQRVVVGQDNRASSPRIRESRDQRLGCERLPRHRYRIDRDGLEVKVFGTMVPPGPA